jgi:hypothetical protein
MPYRTERPAPANGAPVAGRAPGGGAAAGDAMPRLAGGRAENAHG